MYVLLREIRFIKDAILACTLNTQRRSLTPKLLQLTEIQGTLPSRELFLLHRLKKASLCSEGIELMVNARYLYVALSLKSYVCIHGVNACNVQREVVFLFWLISDSINANVFQLLLRYVTGSISQNLVARRVLNSGFYFSFRCSLTFKLILVLTQNIF